MVRSRIRLILVVVAAVAMVAPGASAQAPSQGAPTAQAAAPAAMQPGMLLVVGRMQIKPGKDTAVEKIEHTMAALNESKELGLPRTLGMNAVFGNTEALFLAPMPSYAALDTVVERYMKMPAPVMAQMGQLNAQEGNLIDSGGMMICRYVHDYSYQASTDVSAYRYMNVITYRVKPGRSDDFMKMAKLYTDALKKGNPEGRWAMFQVLSGGYQGTFLVMVPMKKLADMAPDPAINKAVMGALGAEGAQKLGQMEADIVASATSTVYAFNPSMSTVAPVYAKSDPWWTWKAPAALKNAAPAKPGEAKQKAAAPAKK